MKTGYTPTPVGKHRHHQHGQALAKRRQQYRRNRSKAKIQHHLWYQKNKHNPAFKRKQKMRRQNPQRFRMRRGSEEIAFVLGPEMEMGCVVGVHPETGIVSYLVGGEEKEMKAMDFMKSVVFLTPDDMDRMFDLIDNTWGDEGYAEWDLPDPTPELAARVASLFSRKS